MSPLARARPSAPSRLARRLTVAAAALSALAASASAHADAKAPLLPDAPPDRTLDVPIPKTAIGFSKLLLRIEGKDEIGIANADATVRILERMRSKGFHAVGAENLVFGKDESNRAEYVIGGTVKEVVCAPRLAAGRCRIGVEWQVLDVARDEVVYTVFSRAAVLEAQVDTKRVAGLLLDGAIDRLLERPAFRRTIAPQKSASEEAASKFAPATLARCAAGSKVADGADDLLRDVVVVKGQSGFGSGFFVSPEGLVLTAAHVVDAPTLKLRLRTGTEIDAVPIRVSEREDVALLRPVTPLTGQPCAVLREDAPGSGAEVYAAGAPASLDLAFSLSRGIVSGLPIIAGHRRVQTDASVNPGNSGGPLADASGAAAGVISFKIVGTKVEGVAFAVPMRETLSALGLRTGDATDPALLTAPAAMAEHDKAAMFKDAEDPVPSLDPEGDRQRAMAEATARAVKAEADAEEDRDRRTPGYVKAMKIGGWTLAGVGALTTVGTYLSYDSTTTTPATYSTLRAWNAVGIAAMGIGLGSVVLSFTLRPAKSPPKTGASVAVGVGPGTVECQGAF